jgi:Holliday junction resolvase RusA-like endonuclease
VRIAFKVPAVPVAQPRQKQRVMMVGGRAMASNYMPAKHPVNAFKASVALACQQAYRGAVIGGEVEIQVVAVFPRPKSLMWKSRPMPRLRKLSKPDFDNVSKAICDALSGVLFRDDAQVWKATVEKWVAAGDEQPHVEVIIEAVE